MVTSQKSKKRRGQSNSLDAPVLNSANDNAELDADSNTKPSTRFWQSSTFGWSMLSAIAVWLAFPPVGIWPLAWIAPFGWLRLIRAERLDGKRPAMTIALVAYGHWLLMTQWVRLPHPAAAVGWLFLAAYLSIYLVAFIYITRWIVQRAGVSSVFAAPIVWTALEVARSYLFTGWALVLLSHSQVDFLPILQVASFSGAYGVSFLVMLFAAAVERTLQKPVANAKRPWWPLGLATAVVTSAIAFGFLSMQPSPPAGDIESRKTAKVAIVQGSLDTVFGGSSDRLDRAFNKYKQLTEQAVSESDVDLVVWPESMFRFGIIQHDEELKDARFYESDSMTIGEEAQLGQISSKRELQPFRTASLVGTDTSQLTLVDGDRLRVDRFNTAAFYDAKGELNDTYYKVHPVMFGEYIPFGEMFPWLYSLTPMHGGLARGPGAEVFELESGVTLSPNICFENTVPHLIRRHVYELDQAGKRVDVLVTLTNDGWFWGSSLLDLHLACGIFRAVENRRPLLIAANTGFSAHVDAYGRVLAQGPRRANGIILADVNTSELGVSAYTRWGDWFGQFCILLTIAGVIVGYGRAKR